MDEPIWGPYICYLQKHIPSFETEPINMQRVHRKIRGRLNLACDGKLIKSFNQLVLSSGIKVLRIY